MDRRVEFLLAHTSLFDLFITFVQNAVLYGGFIAPQDSLQRLLHRTYIDEGEESLALIIRYLEKSGYTLTIVKEGVKEDGNYRFIVEFTYKNTLGIRLSLSSNLTLIYLIDTSEIKVNIPPSFKGMLMSPSEAFVIRTQVSSLLKYILLVTTKIKENKYDIK